MNAVIESLEYRMAIARYHGALDSMRSANTTPDAFGYNSQSFRWAECEYAKAKAEMERLAERDYRAANPIQAKP